MSRATFLLILTLFATMLFAETAIAIQCTRTVDWDTLLPKYKTKTCKWNVLHGCNSDCTYSTHVVPERVSKSCPTPKEIRQDYKPDGCSLPIVTTGKWKRKFQGACNEHDYCYATLGVDRKQCDQDFRTNMNAICEVLDNKSAVKTCKDVATLWYDGVRLGGKEAYDNGQTWAQGFCDADDGPNEETVSGSPE